MADTNSPFNRVIFNNAEEAVTADFNRLQSLQSLPLRYLVELLYTPRASASSEASGTPDGGFIGESFRVRARNSGLTVRLVNGIGFQYDALALGMDLALGINSPDGASTTGIGDLSAYKPLVLNTNYPTGLPGEILTLAAAPAAPNARYDLIEVRYNRAAADQQVRRFFSKGPPRAKQGVNNTPKTVNWDLHGLVGTVPVGTPSSYPISVVQGTVAASPTVPAGTAGYLPLAAVYIGSDVTSLPDDSVVIDMRRLLFPFRRGHVGMRVQVALGSLTTPTIINAHAPPGVKLLAYYKSMTGGEIVVYIIGGLVTQTANYSVQVEGLTAGTTYTASVTPTLISIGAGDVTAITGAHTVPTGSKVALGQSALALDITASAQTGGTTSQTVGLGSTVTYNISVDFGG